MSNSACKCKDPVMLFSSSLHDHEFISSWYCYRKTLSSRIHDWETLIPQFLSWEDETLKLQNAFSCITGMYIKELFDACCVYFAQCLFD